MSENEMKANLFGGYEQGRDPWALQPLLSLRLENETAAPQVKALAKATTDYMAQKAACAALSKAALDRTKQAEQVRKQTRYAKCSILQDVVYIIREVLEKSGVHVSQIIDESRLPTYNLVRSQTRFLMPAFDVPNFREQVAKQFLDEFLRNNPERRHMRICKEGLPQGVDFARHFGHKGLALRAIVYYDISTDEYQVCVDCTYAIVDAIASNEASNEEKQLCLIPTGADQTRPG